MSYILEALKKAQAERQLGNSPTIHAPTLQAGTQTSADGRLRKPVLLVLAAMALAIVVLVALILRPVAPVVTAAATETAVDPATTAAATTASVPPQPATALPDFKAQTAATALPEPVTALPPPVATVTTSLVQPSTVSTPSAPVPAAVPKAVPTAAPVAVPATAPAAVAREEPVLNLRELPEPIQRAIPQVAVGGYIYSKNPADRLLLVDKILRREGEEVAPGLLLEKLNPKEAIFSYKGYRYRVPY